MRVSLLFRSALCASFLASVGAAQQSIAWTELFDGQGFSEGPADIATDSAGNVYVAGTSETAAGFQDSDWYVQKIDPSGSTLWSTTLDGFGLNDDAFALVVDDVGQLYVAGGMQRPAFGVDFAVAKFDASGVHQWSRTYQGAAGADEDLAFDLCLDSAGNVVAVGRATQANGRLDAVAVAWTPAGVPLWDVALDGSLALDDQAGLVAPGPSGEVYLAASLNSGLGNLGDAGLARVDAGGSLAWSVEIDGGQPSGFDRWGGLSLAANGDLLATGGFSLPVVGQRLRTVRYAPDGSELWTRDFVDLAGSSGLGESVLEGADGTLWVGGSLLEGGLQILGLVVRYDAAGTLLSSDTVSFVPEATQGLGLTLGSAGQAFLSGFTFNAEPYALFVAQFDALGALTWKTRFTTDGSDGNDFRAVAGLPGGDLVLASRTLKQGVFDFDGLTVRLDLSESPQAYCTAKTASVGCEPRMSFGGLSSAAATTGFRLRAEGMINQKFGLFAYSVSGAAEIPFGGGLLCVAGPVRRAPVGFTGGNVGPDDCSGLLELDVNAYATGALGGGPDPALSLPGTAVHVQAWGRDTGFAPPNAVQLSNALRYVVLP